MAQKKITDLQLRDNVSAELNFPSDDGIQSYRVTAAQLLAYILPEGIYPVGSEMGFWGSTAPNGWVLASGRSIGNASSGGTERANDDTENLFTLLWNSTANTELPILDSAGTASTRGANAAADFDANKRMPLPDMRGRVGIGKDNMGGTAANRMVSAAGLDGLTVGKSGGAQTHTLDTTQMPSHTHTQNSHTHNINLFYADQGAGAADYVRGSGNAGGEVGNRVTDASTATNQNTGGGLAHNNTQPSIVRNVLIKL